MMKKILFVINNMNIGGIQKSLVNLLKSINQIYDITLYCVKQEGEYINDLPDNIKIIFGNPIAEVSEQSLDQAKNASKQYMMLRLFFVLWSKMFGKKIPAMIFTKLIGKIEGNYDVAISFSQPIEDESFCVLNNEIVLNCTHSNRKITFVHCDFSAYGGNTKYNRALYRKFDVVAAVSDSVGEQFEKINPEFLSKVLTVRNCCDYERIRLLADEDTVSYNKPALVTVARLGKEKGLLRCIPIVRLLKDEKIEFEWHIVGGGQLEHEISQSINEENLEDTVFLHGEQTNPYRYVKNAEYFFLPSFHEAAPIVFDEAMCLGVPILTTKTLSAEELVVNRKIGVVCDNNEEGIYNMLLCAFSANEELIFESNIIDNVTAVNQFNMICEEQFDRNECIK